jgi:hypothetical protein
MSEVRDLSMADFEPLAGQTFTVTAAEGEVAMTLIAVERLQGSVRSNGGFRLEFQGPLAPALEQAIVEVAGPDHRDAIFLVPIAREPAGMRYEAVFY